MSLSFLIICAVCFKHVSSSREGGAVLSCGDFLCGTCVHNLRQNICSACGKQGIRIAPLNSSLPDEVKRNISDPFQEFESLHNSLTFQIRYYKQTIKRLSQKINKLEEHSQSQLSKIEDLENAKHKPFTSFDLSNDRNAWSDLSTLAPLRSRTNYQNEENRPETKLRDRPSLDAEWKRNSFHLDDTKYTDDASSVGSHDSVSKAQGSIGSPLVNSSTTRLRSPHSQFVRGIPGRNSLVYSPLSPHVPSLQRGTLPHRSTISLKPPSPIKSFIKRLT